MESNVMENRAIIERFKTLLISERSKFNEYLTLLDKESQSLLAGGITSDSTKLGEYTAMGNQMIESISNLQKVIVPFFKMYSSIASADCAASKAIVTSLQADLIVLKAKVLEKNKKTRELLLERMSATQKQLESFKNPYAGVSSVFIKKQSDPVLVAENA